MELPETHVSGGATACSPVMLRTPFFGGRSIPAVSLHLRPVDSSCGLPRSFAQFTLSELRRSFGALSGNSTHCSFPWSSLGRACLIHPRPATNPSPGPRRLAKAPSRSTLSPRERALFPTLTRTRNGSPLPWGEGARRRRAGEGFFHSGKAKISFNLRVLVEACWSTRATAC